CVDYCLFYVLLYLLFFFFFQAEDGIRDDLVTGVQTCALPISMRARERGRARRSRGPAPRAATGRGCNSRAQRRAQEGASKPCPEIGRASCRERGWIGEGGARRKQK